MFGRFLDMSLEFSGGVWFGDFYFLVYVQNLKLENEYVLRNI